MVHSLTARTRKSAAKARKSMQPGSSAPDSATLEIVDKSLRLVKRHRKQRHAKLRDMTREDDDIGGLSGFQSGRGRWAGTSGGTLCPVCMKLVPGDPDVVEAHVDACLAHEARIQEEREREAAAMLHRQERDDAVDIDGDVRVLATDGASLTGESSVLGHKQPSRIYLTGLGFAIRDHSQQDVEDDIDVDGEDEGAYGVAQFSEGDVMNPLAHIRNEEEDVDIDDDEHESSNCSSSGNGGSGVQTLRDLAAEGKVEVVTSHVQEPTRTMDQAAGTEGYEELDRAIELAKKSGKMRMLVEALERKLSVLVRRIQPLLFAPNVDNSLSKESTRLSASTSLCRICLDPYTEPTISTGCWHTCCRECWLRCLGSTRLCPMCKRITVAADLRRVFL